MRNFLLSTALLIIAHFSYGQDQWLVTAQLDTIYGKIFLDAGDQYKADEAQVKIGKEKTNYKSYHLRTVHLEKDRDYEVLQIDQRYQFVEVDLKGKYFSQYLYLDPATTNSSNFVMKIMVDWRGEQYKVSNLTSRKRIAQIFEDCETVSDQILAGELKKSELDKIFAAYDACIDEINNQTQPVVDTPPPSTDMKAFISDLKSKDLYQGDLSSMIDDINQKLSNGQAIPKYLQQALLEQLGENEELKAKFLALVQ